jgi:uncharacterized protein (DUF1800 family)
MCFEHPNSAPFFAKLMIQRLVSSNPSPRYVKAVVEAFRSGTYGSFGSGAYGDIGATVAAILLDREARSSTLLADPHHGRIREPLLKVLHLMRAQDFASRGGQEVEFEGLTSKIGQMVSSVSICHHRDLHICSIRYRRDSRLQILIDATHTNTRHLPA